MMDAVSISAGMFANFAYDLFKNGGAMTLPFLREKLRDWAFSDETANHIVELSSTLPADKLIDAKAFEEHIQASGLWQSYLKEITQPKTEYNQTTNNSGEIGQQHVNQGGTNYVTNNYYGQPTHQKEASPTKKS